VPRPIPEHGKRLTEYPRNPGRSQAEINDYRLKRISGSRALLQIDQARRKAAMNQTALVNVVQRPADPGSDLDCLVDGGSRLRSR